MASKIAPHLSLIDAMESIKPEVLRAPASQSATALELAMVGLGSAH